MHRTSNNDRINALNNAIASVETEGFKFADGEKELCMEALEGTKNSLKWLNETLRATLWRRQLLKYHLKM